MLSDQTPRDGVLTIIHIGLATVSQPYRNAYACKGRHKVETATWAESIAKNVAEKANRAYRFRKDGEAMPLPEIEAVAFRCLAAMPIDLRRDYASTGANAREKANREIAEKILDALAAEHEVCFEPDEHKGYYPADPMRTGQ